MGILSHLRNTRLLLSISSMAIAVALVLGATIAYFSDTETSTGNNLTAGQVDLKIDNTSYLNGSPNPGTTWALADLTNQLFFNFTDVKPGDLGEDTISLHVESNPCWLCAQITLTKNDDNTCNEPENIDDPACNDPDGDLFDGELGAQINFIFWQDDGDNVLETGEQIIKQGTALDALDESITLADSVTSNLLGIGDGQPMQPGINYFIGKAWCFGTLTPDPQPPGPGNPTVESGVDCDGSQVNNAAQTDTLMADITFNAVQARNNPNFVCPNATPSPSPSVSPSPSSSPEPCNTADVMLVLDRSGSINSTELTDLKTAATDFVTALGLAPAGINAGQSSFATTGSLDQALTGSPAALNAAIAALTSGGFTNLKAGIDLATTELNVNDRPDITSPDKMIIITDGHPNRPLPSDTADDAAKASADAARAAGIEVFVVGVGSDVNAAYLQTVADDAAHYFSVADYTQLETTLENLDICP